MESLKNKLSRLGFVEIIFKPAYIESEKDLIYITLEYQVHNSKNSNKDKDYLYFTDDDLKKMLVKGNGYIDVDDLVKNLKRLTIISTSKEMIDYQYAKAPIKLKSDPVKVKLEVKKALLSNRKDNVNLKWRF